MVIANIVMIGITICSLVYAYHFYKQDREIITLNEETIKENQHLEQESLNKRKELSRIKEIVDQQNDILTSLKKNTEEMRKTAKDQAKQEYDSWIYKLTQEYNEQRASLDSKYFQILNIKKKQVEIEENKLNDLKAKQLVYIQAKQREEEINSKQDYYRLVISENDKKEIQLLRNIQLQFTHKEIIDKLIWEGYIKPAFDILASHIYNSKEKICGIYRITNLINGQSYIGQSVDCKERARQHIKAGLAATRATNKLYQQMQDYGVDNFTFEILEEISREKLNERETYWINFYENVLYGLNSQKGNKEREK